MEALGPHRERGRSWGVRFGRETASVLTTGHGFSAIERSEQAGSESEPRAHGLVGLGVSLVRLPAPPANSGKGPVSFCYVSFPDEG